MNIQSLSSLNFSDLEALLQSLGVNPDDPRVPQTLKDFEAVGQVLTQIANDPTFKVHDQGTYTNMLSSAMNDLICRLNYLTERDPTPLISNAECQTLKNELEQVTGKVNAAFADPTNFAQDMQDAQYALAEVEADFMDAK